MSELTHEGKCLCGEVAVTVTTRDNTVAACHCNMCRKWSGGVLFALESVADVSIRGEDHVTIYASSEWAERGFCKHCGTHLFYRLQDRSFYSVTSGLFEAHAWKFDQQLFVDEQPDFYAFSNDTKRLTGEQVFALFASDQDQPSP